MAEENIWKKQAQLNRMKAEGKNQSPGTNNNPSSPINAYLKNNNNSTPSPPWAKSSTPSNTPPQPPWAKTSSPPPDSNLGQPSWINRANNQPINTIQSANQSSNQPPWAKNNTASQPPWAKNNTQTQPATQSTQPPWAKNSPTASNQPPWARQSEPEIKSQESINQPPWAKSAHQIEVQPKQPESVNQPPWPRGNDNTIKSSRVSGDKVPQPSPSNSNPPWMKRQSPQVQRNSWKMKQSQEIERQKQDLQDQIRRQEEQQRQRKRIQKEKREKEIQQANQLREIVLMQKEEEYSVTRERFDQEELERKEQEQKEEEQRLRKEQEERLRKQEEKRRQEQYRRKRQEEIKRLEEEARIREAEDQQRRQKERITELDRSSKTSKSKQKSKKTPLSKRKKKQLLQNSKISHISSIKGVEHMNNLCENDPCPPQNLYHKYLRLINQETTEYDYKKKIQLQQHLYQLQLECRRECQKQIKNLFAIKKVTNRKRKFFFSNSMQIQYALCEGKKGQNGLYFDTQEVQELKTKFFQYELLTKCVLNLMKKKINLHLRVPLINYAEHKGISFLVEHVSQQLIDIIEIQIGLFQEIANEVLVFEKELELAQEEHPELRPITKDMLMVKKITIDEQDYYILYIKAGKKIAKIKSLNNSNALVSKMLLKFNQLNDLNLLELIIGQNTLLPYYQPPLEITREAYEQMEKVAAPALRKIVYNLCRARAIHTVYSSCQGEVQEESFFQLVLEGNKEIWEMIVAAGCPDRNPPEPIVLAYLQSLSSVKFKYQSNMFTRKKKALVQRVEPAVFVQRYDYELLQFIKNFDKYISEDKEELVEQSLSLSRQLFEDIKQGQTHSAFNFLKLKNEVSYLLYKRNENEALQQVERGRETVGKLSLQSIPLNILALKIYIAKDMEVPMLKTLSELLQTLEFYFGQESMLHALVYTAVGIYYSKKAEEPEAAHERKVVTFYEHSLNITLKLYGEKAQEVADIYLSRAIAFINLGRYDSFSKDIQQALKIYKMHSKSGPRIAECNHLMGRVKCKQNQMAEGIQLMELSSSQYMKMYNHVQSLCILFEILPYLQNNQTQLETKIQQIVQICFTYKSIWAFKRIATAVLDRQLNCYTSLNVHSLQELFHPLDEDDRTNEEVLIDLEEEIKGFSSFIEIVRWALSIIAAKMAARREVTGDYQKAHTIIREVIHFYGKSEGISMDLRDSQLL